MCSSINFSSTSLSVRYTLQIFVNPGSTEVSRFLKWWWRWRGDINKDIIRSPSLGHTEITINSRCQIHFSIERIVIYQESSHTFRVWKFSYFSYYNVHYSFQTSMLCFWRTFIPTLISSTLHVFLPHPLLMTFLILPNNYLPNSHVAKLIKTRDRYWGSTQRSEKETGSH